MHVEVDPRRCARIAICEALAPDVFTIDAADELQIAETIPLALEHDVKRAVSGCPMHALRIT